MSASGVAHVSGEVASIYCSRKAAYSNSKKKHFSFKSGHGTY